MPVIRWIRRHPIICIVLVVLAIPIGLGLDWYYLPNRPTTSVAKVESVEVHLHRFNVDEPGRLQVDTRVSTTDSEQIRALLDVFRGAKRAESHNCGASGTITMRRKDDTSEEVHILPGHDEVYYEYWYHSRINRVDRQAFLSALAAMGVHGVKILAP